MSEEFVDITPNKDGGVLKKLLNSGSGDIPPNGSEVEVHYNGTLDADGSQFDSSVNSGPFKFGLGHGEVIKGWDVGVATMRKGEKCILKIRSDYGYGARGSPPKIPGGATLIFEVELLDFSVDNSKLPPELKLKFCEEHKKIGNDLFKEKKYTESKKEYEEVIERLKELGDVPSMEPKLNDLKNMMIGIHSNLTLLCFKTQIFDEGVKSATSAIEEILKLYEKPKEEKKEEKKEVEEKKEEEKKEEEKKEEEKVEEKKEEKVEEKKEGMVKVEEVDKKEYSKEDSDWLKKLYFRRCQCFVGGKDFEKAMEDAKNCLDLDPSSKLFKREKLKIGKLLKAKQKREKKAFGGLFSKMAKMEAEEEKTKKKELEEIKKVEEEIQKKREEKKKKIVSKFVDEIIESIKERAGEIKKVEETEKKEDEKKE